MNAPRPTRIKITTDKAGDKSYTPQHKGWLFWYNFGSFEGWSSLAHTNPMMYAQIGPYTDLKQAQGAIDAYITAFRKAEALRNLQTIVSTKYVKYP